MKQALYVAARTGPVWCLCPGTRLVWPCNPVPERPVLASEAKQSRALCPPLDCFTLRVRNDGHATRLAMMNSPSSRTDYLSLRAERSNPRGMPSSRLLHPAGSQ
ncbi:MAG: hypothetical protein LBT00_13190 [Spirochaetaceae bacterium]|nr:hypothetical protein [Spirochaetaceae bacterium]